MQEYHSVRSTLNSRTHHQPIPRESPLANEPVHQPPQESSDRAQTHPKPYTRPHRASQYRKGDGVPQRIHPTVPQLKCKSESNHSERTPNEASEQLSRAWDGRKSRYQLIRCARGHQVAMLFHYMHPRLTGLGDQRSPNVEFDAAPGQHPAAKIMNPGSGQDLFIQHQLCGAIPSSNQPQNPYPAPDIETVAILSEPKRELPLLATNARSRRTGHLTGPASRQREAKVSMGSLTVIV